MYLTRRGSWGVDDSEVGRQKMVVNLAMVDTTGCITCHVTGIMRGLCPDMYPVLTTFRIHLILPYENVQKIPVDPLQYIFLGSDCPFLRRSSTMGLSPTFFDAVLVFYQLYKMRDTTMAAHLIRPMYNSLS